MAHIGQSAVAVRIALRELDTIARADCGAQLFTPLLSQSARLLSLHGWLAGRLAPCSPEPRTGWHATGSGGWQPRAWSLPLALILQLEPRRTRSVQWGLILVPPRLITPGRSTNSLAWSEPRFTAPWPPRLHRRDRALPRRCDRRRSAGNSRPRRPDGEPPPTGPVPHCSVAQR